MENSGAVSKISTRRTVLLCSGGLFQALYIGFVLLYGVNLCKSTGVLPAALILSLGGVFAAATVPFMYFLINRTRSNFWGRYHFTLAVLIIVTATLCASLWGILESPSYAVRVAVPCVLLPFFASGVVSIGYISSSIGTRLLGADFRGVKYRAVFNALGLVAGLLICALPLTGLDPDCVGYALACLILVAGSLLYYAGIGSLPRFVRPLSRKITLGTVREEFFRKPAAKSALASSAYIAAAVSAMVALGYIPVLSGNLFDAEWIVVCCAAIAVLTATAAYLIAKGKRFGVRFALIGAFVVCVWSVILTLFPRFYALEDLSPVAVVFVSFGAMGFGFGILLAVSRSAAGRFADRYSSGSAFCIEAMLLLVATGIALALVAGLNAISVGTDIVFTAVTGGLALLAGILTTAAFALKPKTAKEGSEVVQSQRSI